VRITYSPNRTAGQWGAHGKYIGRDSAAHESVATGVLGVGEGIEPGFGAGEESTDAASLLSSWQQAGDERLFKIILSPEFGERADLRSLTRGLMSKMERDVGTSLEWVAAAHYNTAHPHVHIALRGVTDKGKELRIDRGYIQHGIRSRAQEECTAQLGYRTPLDAQEAQRREISQPRYTSLDRILQRQERDSAAECRHFSCDPAAGVRDAVQRRHLTARLAFLSQMGLAEQVPDGSWHVRRDFQAVLKKVQQLSDRQRVLAQHSAFLSDPRLALQVTTPRQIDFLEGRVIAHGEEDNGRTYMILEGTDAKVYYLYHTREISERRHKGQLRPNAFVQMEKRFIDGRPTLTVTDLGDADKLLSEGGHFRNTAKRLLQRGVLQPDGSERQWGGWLGRYRSKLNHEILRQAHAPKLRHER
jgi:type IV secretory pathway VirD2 relaxase